jgi:hypothetical protein
MPKPGKALRTLNESRERRLATRYKMILRIGLLAHGERSTFCLVKNISPAGAEVRLYGRVPDGADVTLRVGDEDAISGRIAWTHDTSAGVEFHTPLDTTTILRAMQKLPPAKRRSSPRVKVPARVLLRTAGRSYAGTLRDISATGARVGTQRPIRLGPSMMITLPGLPAIKAFVRWNDDTELGLAFESPLPIQLIAEWMGERVHVSG